MDKVPFSIDWKFFFLNYEGEDISQIVCKFVKITHDRCKLLPNFWVIDTYDVTDQFAFKFKIERSKSQSRKEAKFKTLRDWV